MYQDSLSGQARIGDEELTTTNANDHQEKFPLFTKKSFPVNLRPFSKDQNACFAVGKDRQGLALSLAQYCDAFVHVPHHNYDTNSDNTPILLDHPSCISITLHEFTEHAGYNERKFQGHKFQVTPRQQRLMDAQDVTNRKSERKREKQQREQDAVATVEDGVLGNMFGSDELASTNGDY